MGDRQVMHNKKPTRVVERVIYRKIDGIVRPIKATSNRPVSYKTTKPYNDKLKRLFPKGDPRRFEQGKGVRLYYTRLRWVNQDPRLKAIAKRQVALEKASRLSPRTGLFNNILESNMKLIGQVSPRRKKQKHPIPSIIRKNSRFVKPVKLQNNDKLILIRQQQQQELNRLKQIREKEKVLRSTIDKWKSQGYVIPKNLQGLVA